MRRHLRKGYPRRKQENYEDILWDLAKGIEDSTELEESDYEDIQHQISTMDMQLEHLSSEDPKRIQMKFILRSWQTYTSWREGRTRRIKYGNIPHQLILFFKRRRAQYRLNKLVSEERLNVPGIVGSYLSLNYWSPVHIGSAFYKYENISLESGG